MADAAIAPTAVDAANAIDESTRTTEAVEASTAAEAKPADGADAAPADAPAEGMPPHFKPHEIFTHTHQNKLPKLLLLQMIRLRKTSRPTRRQTEQLLRAMEVSQRARVLVHAVEGVILHREHTLTKMYRCSTCRRHLRSEWHSSFWEEGKQQSSQVDRWRSRAQV